MNPRTVKRLKPLTRWTGWHNWSPKFPIKAIARDTKDQLDEGAVLANLGSVSHFLGHMKEAKNYIEEAIAIFDEIQSPYSEKARDLLKKIDSNV